MNTAYKSASMLHRLYDGARRNTFTGGSDRCIRDCRSRGTRGVEHTRSRDWERLAATAQREAEGSGAFHALTREVRQAGDQAESTGLVVETVAKIAFEAPREVR